MNLVDTLKQRFEGVPVALFGRGIRGEDMQGPGGQVQVIAAAARLRCLRTVELQRIATATP